MTSRMEASNDAFFLRLVTENLEQCNYETDSETDSATSKKEFVLIQRH